MNDRVFCLYRRAVIGLDDKCANIVCGTHNHICQNVGQTQTMDEFVLRGDAAMALANSQAKATSASLQKRQRQTRIYHGDKVVSEERVQYLKEEMDEAKTIANMLNILHTLEHLFVSLEMLEKTHIGVSLTRLSRRTESHEVHDRAQKLLKVWKTRAKMAMRRRARRVEMYGRNYAE
ncbi:transcription elongation factor a protein 1 [Plasmopara halstedii]|uniref:Transcription elongation factor a protein 1 n=1 Tax=Plasmopara halstedii TaxID=4781 RepID=A0A0P1ALW9_PLAHL|nr:transcription elongation factor a protein 1 [Plasmopara halstedii]CEG42330.1 transcription elongation factor a protein 1 [Plasmopara halstedii]|eukprot:XP_024578699.1 transcription elongation factor a protein 1 [Plasmopara halstedii]